jgi:hypothetical protein
MYLIQSPFQPTLYDWVPRFHVSRKGKSPEFQVLAWRSRPADPISRKVRKFGKGARESCGFKTLGVLGVLGVRSAL